MKLQGHDSARAFTQRIDEEIARRAAGAPAEVLPRTNREEITSSEIRSLHTKTRFQPDILEKTRRQR